ncbi:MAG: hypothetical protein NTY12_05315 [Candidatus Falkowbacteria bacterium]|nr:hypothetical protein [Candidatus Falkowbacteria bacterium]
MWHYSETYEFLKKAFSKAGVKMGSIGRYSDVPDEDLHFPPSDERLKDYTLEEKQAILEACGSFVHDGDITIEQLDLLKPFFPSVLPQLYFQPDLSEKDISKLRAFLDEYIDRFLNGELIIYDKNCLTFERQKADFIQEVKFGQFLEKYGNNFVIRDFSFKDSDGDAKYGTLFVHTLYALEKLGFIKVRRLWQDKEITDTESKAYASIMVLEPLLEEMTSNYKKENPENIFEKYEESQNILLFAGKEIELSRKKKQTDPVLLIKTLLQEPERYWHEDEITEDWGYNEEDEVKKNKVYYAARKLNDLVQLKTGINDFIDHNTDKFRINPKYLKS